MTKKIFRSSLIVAATVSLAAIIIITGILYNYFNSSTILQLKSQLDFAANGVENCGIEYLNGISQNNYRLTLIKSDGSVIFDTDADAAKMDNHIDRAEIKSALNTGYGESERFSATLLEKTFYCAKKLKNGDILRICATQYSVLTLLLGIMQPIIVIFVLAIILSAILAKRMSKKIVEPLNNLDFENPLENDIYDEISPLLLHIEQQNRRIRRQFEEIKQNRKKFDAVIENMNEALIILDEDENIITANNAAMRLFKTNKECIGKSFLLTERSFDVDNALKEAENSGHSEVNIQRAGGEYQLNISRIGGKKKLGTVILAFDVTDKVFAERNRKEFTANVSHELKTPLQSIMGSAELIENGLVKSQDMPRFIKNIHSEANRLVTLIDDIIRLSALDEKSELEFESVDLYEIAKEVMHNLKNVAEAKNISLELDGKSTEINGVKQLVYEIVNNICENAVKYNKDNGQVKISVEKSDDGTYFTVSDTGIGIDEEHQTRVFERFYRVDKSHSKKIGGTGLGLSIVKHAADCLGAEVKLESVIGKGTAVTVKFKY